MQLGFLASAWFYSVLGLLAGLLSVWVRHRSGTNIYFQLVIMSMAIAVAIASANSLGFAQFSKWLSLISVGILAALGSFAFRRMKRTPAPIPNSQA